MQFTQKEALTLLKESGREGWTLRQMTALRTEGYLPPLRRLTKPGTNKPLYVWVEEDAEQICNVYDWWEQYQGDRATLTLRLWLHGYDVPIERLRCMYLDVIEGWIEQLTQGETDLDTILEAVIHATFALVQKYKYTPGPAITSQRKKYSAEQMESIIEHVLSAVAVAPDLKLIDEAARSFHLLTDEKEEDLIEALNELFVTPEHLSAVLRDILALPHLYEVVQEATIEQWKQARDDYVSLCQRIKELGDASGLGDLTILHEFIDNMTMHGACWLIVPFISTRYHKYGRWIDLALKKMHEVFTDPSFRARMVEIKQTREVKKAENR